MVAKCKRRYGLLHRCRLNAWHVLNAIEHQTEAAMDFPLRAYEMPTEGELDRIAHLRATGVGWNRAHEAVYESRVRHQEVRRLTLKIGVIVLFAAGLVVAVTLMGRA